MAPFIVSDKVQGQNISEDRKIIFGLRCGPLSYDIQSLIHEMAHFVEIDEKRMFKYAWGLKLPEKYVLGRRCIEPTTNQPTMRELRVGAIQMNILEWLGENGYIHYDRYAYDWQSKYVTELYSLDEAIANFIRSMDFMPDWYMIPGKTKEARTLWMTRKLKRFMKTYTIEWFLKRWGQRCEIVRQKHRK